MIVLIKILLLLFLNMAFVSAFATSNPLYWGGKNNLNTDVILIVKDEKIILEEYARGYKAKDKHLSWSMAKTVAGILVAQAIEQGYLSINDQVDAIIPEFRGGATVRDILQMSSGVLFSEVYSGVPVTADVTKMLYLDGPKVGFGNYTVSLPLRKEKPGMHFYYSSGDTNILMEMLKRKLPQDLYEVFPWLNLFEPLGVDATFEMDAQDRFVGSSYLYMTPSDYIKLANLIENNGVYNTQQIIPLWYMQMMKNIAPGVRNNSINPRASERAYSSQLTTNLPIEERKLPSEYQFFPQDGLLLFGHQGQILAISPSEKLTVLRLATDKGSALDKKLFFKQVFKYIKKQKNIELKVSGKENNKNNFSKEIPNETNATLKDYLRVPKLITSLAAKEFCSCYFVVKRSYFQCKKDLAVSLPIVPLIRVVGGEVKAFMHLGSAAIAKFRSGKLGCYLTGI